MKRAKWKLRRKLFRSIPNVSSVESQKNIFCIIFSPILGVIHLLWYRSSIVCFSHFLSNLNERKKKQLLKRFLIQTISKRRIWKTITGIFNILPLRGEWGRRQERGGFFFFFLSFFLLSIQKKKKRK